MMSPGRSTFHGYYERNKMKRIFDDSDASQTYRSNRLSTTGNEDYKAMTLKYQTPDPYSNKFRKTHNVLMYSERRHGLGSPYRDTEESIQLREVEVNPDLEQEEPEPNVQSKKAILTQQVTFGKGYEDESFKQSKKSVISQQVISARELQRPNGDLEQFKEHQKEHQRIPMSAREVIEEREVKKSALPRQSYVETTTTTTYETNNRHPQNEDDKDICCSGGCNIF
jgi:hypothetical protein